MDRKFKELFISIFFTVDFSDEKLKEVIKTLNDTDKIKFINFVQQMIAIEDINKLHILCTEYVHSVSIGDPKQDPFNIDGGVFEFDDIVEVMLNGKKHQYKTIQYELLPQLLRLYEKTLLPTGINDDSYMKPILELDYGEKNEEIIGELYKHLSQEYIIKTPFENFERIFKYNGFKFKPIIWLESEVLLVALFDGFRQVKHSGLKIKYTKYKGMSECFLNKDGNKLTNKRLSSVSARFMYQSKIRNLNKLIPLIEKIRELE